jgi:hypothetical protein
MYNFSDFATLIGFLVILAIVYILFKWLWESKKGGIPGEETERKE